MRMPGFPRELPMLLDRTIITTRFKINPEVFTDRPAFNSKHGTDILDSHPRSRQVGGEDQRTHNLVFGSYGGIVVSAEELGRDCWYATRIHLNPRNVLYRHNGKGVDVEDALIAFTILREEVSTILADPADIIHILPGLHPDSRAFWSLLEIPIDLYDPDGTLEKVFRNPHYPKMGEGFRVRNGTVQIGAGDGPFKIKFYRKDKQMQKLLRKHRVKDAPRVFRVEVVLSQQKLLEHLSNERNVREINGIPRLVSFTPGDLIECHRRIVTNLRGCFQVESSEGSSNQKDKLPRFMALVATHFDIPLVELFDLYETKIGRGERTTTRHRDAARKALASISPVRLEEVFCERNYEDQPSIAIPELQRTVPDDRMLTLRCSEVLSVYGHKGSCVQEVAVG